MLVCGYTPITVKMDGVCWALGMHRALLTVVE
jgi:hypothetical protein